MKLICTLNDKRILGREGLSRKAPRLAARGIVRDGEGLYALIYSASWGLYNLPGGGVEEGEALLAALKRELLEEAGCLCNEVREVGIVEENRAREDFTQTNYYFSAAAARTSDGPRLTEDERANGVEVQWHTFEKLVELISAQELDRIQGKYIKARGLAALEEYARTLLPECAGPKESQV